MTPTHTNKEGARYRYYVSHPILQKPTGGGQALMRAAAQEIETLVINAVRERLADAFPDATRLADRDLIERHVEQIFLKADMIEIQLTLKTEENCDEHKPSAAARISSSVSLISIPWAKDETQAVKGVLHTPSPPMGINGHNRDLLLMAIAKARTWIEDIVAGRVYSFADIAKHEGKVERHIRLLASLAFVSPTLVSAIAERSFRPIGVTELAKAVAYVWSEQAPRFRTAQITVGKPVI